MPRRLYSHVSAADSLYNPASVTSDPRLDTASNVWLATVRPDGRPHLIPIWFVTDKGFWYICTGSHSVKARNLQVNPRVALALEDGTQAYVVEGQARPVSPPAEIVRKFKAKYDWDITRDPPYDQVYEIEITRQIMGQSEPVDDGPPEEKSS